jgi:hypothetical protein
MVYWMSKVAWFGTEFSVQTYYDPEKKLDLEYQDITLAAGVGGVGASYFFRPQAPSIYVTAGAGFSAWTLPFEGSDPWGGFGAAGAIGYEFTRNWSVEAAVLYGKTESDNVEIKYDSDFFAVGLTINVTGY